MSGFRWRSRRQIRNKATPSANGEIPRSMGIAYASTCSLCAVRSNSSPGPDSRETRKPASRKARTPARQYKAGLRARHAHKNTRFSFTFRDPPRLALLQIWASLIQNGTGASAAAAAFPKSKRNCIILSHFRSVRPVTSGIPAIPLLYGLNHDGLVHTCEGSPADSASGRRWGRTHRRQPWRKTLVRRSTKSTWGW